jgi:hypothetical protein
MGAAAYECPSEQTLKQIWIHKPPHPQEIFSDAVSCTLELCDGWIYVTEHLFDILGR